ncbi:7-dehydrocholesterol reductase-like [Antedon mediterranea]|uniref:7-dehydrocholesterol reductase-like n=1 Tax=Antedon mediterranea TaxID=105859 RepID=UPI003AF63F95
MPRAKKDSRKPDQQLATNGISVMGDGNIDGITTVADDRKPGEWGRAWSVNITTYLTTLFILFVTPFIALYLLMACPEFECSVTSPVIQFYHGKLTMAAFLARAQSLNVLAFKMAVIWIMLQILLYYLPDVFGYILPGYAGGTRHGAVTPAGHQLKYNVNGLQSWTITITLWILNGVYFKWFSPSIIVSNWGQLFWVANILGYSLSVFVMIKAHLFPTHAQDRKFSSSIFYDFLMGIELNPRIGKMFDLKLFVNGRIGMMSWSVINISYAWKQYEVHGFVTNSMILVNVLHGLYVIDFFWNEAWYLRTIDIQHDHFGFYLCWGIFVWLPWTYTLQGFYLVHHPTLLSTPVFFGVLLLGIVSYSIFRAVNHQKDLFRRTNGNCKIWGKSPEFIECDYYSGDGKKRRSRLLLSGWWGVARHMNYTGDLFQSLAFCLATGVSHILPYFYFTFISILLFCRCYRDEDSCKLKYGKNWDKYCNRVPYRLVPGVY